MNLRSYFVALHQTFWENDLFLCLTDLMYDYDFANTANIQARNVNESKTIAFHTKKKLCIRQNKMRGNLLIQENSLIQLFG